MTAKYLDKSSIGDCGCQTTNGPGAYISLVGGDFTLTLALSLKGEGILLPSKLIQIHGLDAGRSCTICA